MTTTLVLLCVSWFAVAAEWSQETPSPGVHMRPWFESQHAEEHFEHFIKMNKRNYADESEKRARFEIFKENLNIINSLNLNSDRYHAEYGVTKYADMSPEEFNSKMNRLGSLKDLDSKNACEYIQDEDIIFDKDAPESFDWRVHGVITPVKDQGVCGSCFAFSAIGNIEGQNAIRNKELVRLSEQQIVDCDKEDDGCAGGLMNVAIRSLINQGGSESEADYPYDGRVITCDFDANKVKVKINDCQSFNLTSQEKLKQLLYHTGPIAIGIQGTSLQFYDGGIILDDDCDIGELNHGVLLVGYGTENNTPFWIVKNSWGTSFGEDGYFRMERGEKARSCGVMNDSMTSAVL